mmetsp:Transcript_29116/g.25758  ORF Transcript_29116/g.25758 Transcript_29116/m.25758 type:complete len:124 (+) Transcript_29116:215-586(+)
MIVSNQEIYHKIVRDQDILIYIMESCTNNQSRVRNEAIEVILMLIKESPNRKTIQSLIKLGMFEYINLILSDQAERIDVLSKTFGVLNLLSHWNIQPEFNKTLDILQDKYLYCQNEKFKQNAE